MFEEYTEEYFLNEAKHMGQELGVDTRQGSIYMDAATGHCLRTAKFYSDLSQVFDMLSIDTCGGEILDEKAANKNIYRKEATPAYYNVEFVGMAAADMLGNRFFAEGHYFVLTEYDDSIYLQAEESGTDSNSLLPESSVIPVNNIMGLTAAVLGEIYLEGTDVESDDSLRIRLKEAIIHKAQGGNKQQYKTWCEEFEGVGRAMIYPLADGPNTVKAVLISDDGTAPTEALINEMQEVMDPDASGRGEGKAFIGCHFRVVAVTEMAVSLSFDAEIKSGYETATVVADIKIRLKEYLKEIALNTKDEEVMEIQYIRIFALLASVSGLQDFSNLLVNNGTANISVPAEAVGVLGEVVMNAGV